MRLTPKFKCGDLVQIVTSAPHIYKNLYAIIIDHKIVHEFILYVVYIGKFGARECSECDLKRVRFLK